MISRWLFFCTLVVCMPSFATTVTDTPSVIVERATHSTLTRLHDDAKGAVSDFASIQNTIEQELLPYVDVEFSAIKSLGKHVRAISAAQLDNYTQVFNKYMTVNYALMLSDYTDQHFTATTEHVDSKGNHATVTGVMATTGYSDIQIAFKLRKSNPQLVWKVYDIEIEGLSLVDSKRREFNGLIRQHGVERLMQHMQLAIDNTHAIALNQPQ